MKNINPMNGMTDEQVMERIEKCSALNLCFISLKELVLKPESNGIVDRHRFGKNPLRAVPVMFNGVEVLVGAQFVK